MCWARGLDFNTLIRWAIFLYMMRVGIVAPELTYDRPAQGGGCLAHVIVAAQAVDCPQPRVTPEVPGWACACEMFGAQHGTVTGRALPGTGELMRVLGSVTHGAAHMRGSLISWFAAVHGRPQPDLATRPLTV
jgi:hypothetical protein